MSYLPRYGKTPGSKPPNLGSTPRRSTPTSYVGTDSTKVMGRLAVQNETVINLSVDQDQLETRRTFSANPDVHYPMGSVQRSEDIDVHEYDLIMIESRPYTSADQMPTEGTAHPIASLTGATTNPTIYGNSQEIFEESYQVVGRAIGKHIFDDVKYKLLGVAVQATGTMTINNNGGERLEPGDFVETYLPDIDPVVRKEQMRRVIIAGGRRNFLPPLLRKTSPNGIYKLPQLALAQYMKKYAGKASAVTLLAATPRQAHGTDGTDSKDHLFVAMLKESVLTNVLAAIAILQAGGLVHINTSPAAWADLDRITPENLASTSYNDIGVADATLRQPNENNLVFLAKKLGLVGSVRDVAPQLIEMIVLTANAGLMELPGTAEKREHYRLGKLIGSANGVYRGNNVNPVNTDLTILDKRVLNSSVLSAGKYAEAYRYSKRSTFGVVVTAANPGERVGINR